MCLSCVSCFFFFNDTATTEIYTLSLHDALPISDARRHALAAGRGALDAGAGCARGGVALARDRQGDPQADAARLRRPRSEEHTSELQSRQYLVCRLLLEKKKNSRT